MDISPRQVSAARALLDWTAALLAEKAGVGIATVKRLEAGETVRPASSAAVKAALEGGGIQFLSTGQSGGKGGEGVRRT
ncbi:helix-turn-helix domain-containing protein [Sphingobium nicotianae]|uniref:helix-turn-helix domain-containing protein n=1 Tax=Sphingobium nicotianae TaxID=2782607 RepID=UPI001BE409F7|nr:helix-turn-helix domain-containing protein [Sphingobium nicotianae]